MEKYLKAVSEMYAQFKQREAHPLEKYVGHYFQYMGRKVEVVGYFKGPGCGNGCLLILDGASFGGRGWAFLGQNDVVFKKCESYYYVLVPDLIVLKD